MKNLPLWVIAVCLIAIAAILFATVAGCAGYFFVIRPMVEADARQKLNHGF